MRKQRTKLAGLSHLLRPDPKRVESTAQWNAHIDQICTVMQGLKIEGDSNAAPEPEPQAELPIEEKPKRKAKSKPNRMHEGGEDRDDAA
jgi:hypothetical protein